MEMVSSIALTRGECLRRVALLPLLFLVGCVTPEKDKGEDKPPRAKPCQIVTTWEHRINYAADSVNNGTPLPVMAGRLYMFGTEIGHPMAWDGKLVVDIYDANRPAGSKPLHQWQIDPKTMEQFLRRDRIGWGYTLLLPLPPHLNKPEIPNVLMQVRFDPAEGAPLFTRSNRMTLRSMAVEEGSIAQAGLTPGR